MRWWRYWGLVVGAAGAVAACSGANEPGFGSNEGPPSGHGDAGSSSSLGAISPVGIHVVRELDPLLRREVGLDPYPELGPDLRREIGLDPDPG
jgi:hypothetical protein